MTYNNARNVLAMQDRNLRKINGTRFVHNGYEYRLTYEGGFTSFVCIDRRPINKRNFKYFNGVAGYNCWTVGELMELVMKEIGIEAA